MSTSPAPIAWPPTGQWVGIDGQWSSFALRTGSPGQLSHVLPSSASYTTWLVASQYGCNPSLQKHLAPNCVTGRGGLYNYSESATWRLIGNYSTVVEGYLMPKYDVPATFGFDTVSLGTSNATGLPSLQSQVVGGIGSPAFYNGVFGLNPQASNVSTLNEPQPSFLTTLKTRNLIPSKSWGYTAGASYRNSLASLTFGGYDASRLEANDVSFSLTADTTWDLMVGLRSIKTTTPNGTLTLLPSPTLSFIDTTLPNMYLPPDACQLFAQTFNLQWSQKFALFLIDPETHANNTAKNPNITFTLGDSTTGGSTVDIVLPYTSFQLTAIFPYVPHTMRYFPLRPAQNASQVTLGRVFFQEAYLAVNYEHSNFSISQTKVGEAAKADLVPMPAAAAPSNTPTTPPAAPTPTPSHTASKSSGLSQEAKIGIIAGTTAVIAISFFVLAYFLLRWRSRSHTRKSSIDKSQIRYSLEKQELDGTAFVQPNIHYPVDKKLEKELESSAFVRPRTFSMDKRAELMNYEVVELPDDPIIHEIMSRPGNTWAPGGRKANGKTTYAAYVNVKKAKENRMSNGKVSPPISKFSCAPIREKLVNLNRSLPPTPIWLSPRASRMSTPLPNSRRVPHTPVQNFPVK